jgi:hypothetical protein
MKMITVKCPYCDKEHTLDAAEEKETLDVGKCVISCECNKLYTVAECDGHYFVKS